VFLDSRRLVVRYGRVNWNILKTVIFTIVFPGTVAVYIPYRLRGPDLPVAGGFGLLGWLPIAAGVAVYGWCALDFATFGRGTPSSAGRTQAVGGTRSIPFRPQSDVCGRAAGDPGPGVAIRIDGDRGVSGGDGGTVPLIRASL